MNKFSHHLTISSDKDSGVVFFLFDDISPVGCGAETIDLLEAVCLCKLEKFTLEGIEFRGEFTEISKQIILSMLNKPEDFLGGIDLHGINVKVRVNNRSMHISVHASVV